MGVALADDVKQLLDRANFAHLATVMEDGSPHSTPVWAGREGDRIVVCTGAKSLKARNTRRDPRVAISMVDFKDPYREVQLRGRVVEQRPDPELKVMDAISMKYIGKPFPMRAPEDRVALIIEVDKVRYMKLPFEHTPPK
ncbi:MAG TPA: PPOX class F420-dependent oxidoreductase [Terriglobales bacterium]|nr:PPOX class F420-dependent oxidoreductase [Terriglobales bacterium]